MSHKDRIVEFQQRINEKPTVATFVRAAKLLAEQVAGDTIYWSDFSAAVDIEPALISRYKNGKTIPELSKLLRIRDWLVAHYDVPYSILDDEQLLAFIENSKAERNPEADAWLASFNERYMRIADDRARIDLQQIVEAFFRHITFD